MSTTVSQDRAPRSLPWRIIRGAAVLVFYCWAGKAIYLFLASDFVPYHGTLARAYLAARDSFHDLPATLGFLVELVAISLGWLHQSLVGELGYDPVALPDIDAAIDWPAADLPSLRQLGEHALRIGVTLAAGQFGLFFLILGCGGTVGWRAPGMPVLLNARARLFYWLVSMAGIGGLAYLSLRGGILPAIVALLLGLAFLRFPLLAGLPLWLLEKVFGLHPRRILASVWRFLLAGSRLRQVRGGRRTTAAGSGAGKGHDGARDERRHGPLEERNTDRQYEAACATFELKPGLFARDDLRMRYRELMKKVHPDHQGSARLAMLINADYERVLQHHDWQR